MPIRLLKNAAKKAIGPVAAGSSLLADDPSPAEAATGLIGLGRYANPVGAALSTLLYSGNAGSAEADAEITAQRKKFNEEKKKSGTAKYAKGGGIESRGKTKGTVIRMASGGFVRSADGIAQRGKTKGRVY